MPPPAPDAAPCRLDVWLDVACVFRTRSEAQQACKGGKVTINGVRAKPHRPVKPGDRLEITTRSGRRRLLVVTGLAGTHLPKAEARTLYDDVTPPPSAEEVELRALLRRAHAAGARPPSTPTRRERRVRRRLKGQ